MMRFKIMLIIVAQIKIDIYQKAKRTILTHNKYKFCNLITPMFNNSQKFDKTV